MGTRAVWVLNLDAELELGSRRAYQPTARVRELVRANRARLAALLPEGDLVLDEVDAPGAYAGYRGRAYSPTPSAIAALERAGAASDPAPPLAVLRAVNDRAFGHALGATLPGQALIDSEGALEAHLRAAPDGGEGFLLKRRWSMAGRGRRRVGASAEHRARAPRPVRLDDADRRFVRAALREDEALLVEPFVPILLEATIHGWIRPGGALDVGAPCVQVCDPRGAFASARRALPGELAPSEEAALRASVERVADALDRAGYFGPFGVDAFRYRDDRGAPAFRALSELNARLTMALPIGLGLDGR
jgi:hypothetical protein